VGEVEVRSGVCGRGERSSGRGRGERSSGLHRFNFFPKPVTDFCNNLYLHLF
jgi:hypothetical protein